MVFNKACVWVQVHMAFFGNEFGAFATCSTPLLSFRALFVHKMSFSMKSYDVKNLLFVLGRTPLLAPT